MLSTQKQTTNATAEEIRAAIAASRRKAPMPVPESVRTYVLGKLPIGWQVKENVEYNCFRPNVPNLNISITGTFYQLFIEAPARDGDFCKVSSIYIDGGKRSRWINELGTTTEMMDDILSNAEERIRYWDTQMRPFLHDAGFTMVNEGQYEITLSTGAIVQALPSLFPNCVCVVLRERPAPKAETTFAFLKKLIGCATAPKAPKLPDMIPQRPETLANMIVMLKNTPSAQGHGFRNM